MGGFRIRGFEDGVRGQAIDACGFTLDTSKNMQTPARIAYRGPSGLAIGNQAADFSRAWFSRRVRQVLMLDEFSESCRLQSPYKLALSLTPNAVHGAVFAERTYAAIHHTLVKCDGTIDSFDNL